jgi:hypothetical protein
MNPNYGKKTNDDPLGLKNWGAHDWFTLVQLVLLFLGIFTGGLTSLISLGLGSATGIAEAIWFLVKDDDPYMAGIMAILTIIPGDELLKLPGVGPIIKKRGVDGIIKLIKDNKNGVKLTLDQIADLKKLGEKIISDGSNIKNLFKFYWKRWFLTQISKKSTKFIMNLLSVFTKYPRTVYISGVPIAFDHLYMYVFRDDIEKMNLRNKNEVVKIIKSVGEMLGWRKVNSEDLMIELEKDLKKLENGQIDLGILSPPTENANKNIIERK